MLKGLAAKKAADDFPSQKFIDIGRTDVAVFIYSSIMMGCDSRISMSWYGHASRTEQRI
jgi:hypothetical protein